MFNNSPYYHRLNNGSSLTDIILNSCDSFTDKARYASKVSYECIINDLEYIGLGKPVDTAVKKTRGYLYKNKDLITSFALATGGSIAINMATNYVCENILSLPSDAVTTASYWFEMSSYTGLFTWNYWREEKKKGISKDRIRKKLLWMGATGFAISFFVYKPERAHTIDYAVNTLDVARPLAAGATQLAATGILYFVFKGLNWIDDKYNFKKKMTQKTDAMADGLSDMTEKINETFEVATERIKGSFDILKNGFDNFRNGSTGNDVD